MSDEFGGATLDATKWQAHSPYRYWQGREPSRFDPANVTLGDGMLHLRSTTSLATIDAVRDPAKDVWISSACVVSPRPLASYGFYSARVKASRLMMASAFWLQGAFSEIDIVEQFGDSTAHPEKMMQMLMCSHYFPHGWKDDKTTPIAWRMPTGSAEGFHVYAIWWKDAETIWYYHDGVKVAEMKPAGGFTEPMRLFFDTEVFPWHGLPTIEALTDPSKNTMDVDWVRSWSLVGSDGLPLPGTVLSASSGTGHADAGIGTLSPIPEKQAPGEP